MAKRIKLSQKDIEKVVTNIIKEELDINEVEVQVTDPEIEDEIKSNYVTVKPQGDVVNPLAQEGVTIVKNKNGKFMAINNRTGEIVHKFG